MNPCDGKVISIKDLGEGTRVEIDFIDVLSESEGILVGDSARGYVEVLAETRATDTYPPRPFRVNAGAIHQYIYLGDGKTKYLSELVSGDKILVTDGVSQRLVSIGRIKIEKREFEQIRLDSGITATLQKADSVFLKWGDKAQHLIDLKPGDMITYYADEKIARHKGEAIEETIVEK